MIVENNSTDSATFDYYKKLEAENPKVRMVYWDGVFNYSAINNYGASFAKGEYLLLLNNDTEIINPDCLEELLGYCMRKDVGWDCASVRTSAQLARDCSIRMIRSSMQVL